MKNQTLSILFLLFTFQLLAQYPQGRGKAMNNPMLKEGHFYGKVLDSISGKPIEFASIQLWGNKWDTISKKMKPILLGGMLSQPNGDFSIENIPVFGDFTLKIFFIGFTPLEKNISFGLKREDLGQDAKKSTDILNKVDKDLGNIKLNPSTTLLNEVTIDGSAPAMELKLDKKVFNVEKNITSTGGTAEDVLKNVPSVNVDMDGNVSLRNASPQIFVDGKPTTLTIDQIPADAIESIELITNPSAKYDASAGQGGIINIVLKKQRKIGYNGNIRIGIDKRGKMNLGADINSRQKNTNVFLSSTFRQRKSISNGKTDRYNLIGNPLTNIFQNTNYISEGYFSFIRGGADWFIDNRNTLTLSGNYVLGKFGSTDKLNTETDSVLTYSIPFSFYNRNSESNRNFNNIGASLQYKHLFPKEGKELTADANYSSSLNKSDGLYGTQYYNENNLSIGDKIIQKQIGSGSNRFITIQSDYVYPYGEKIKFETGVRASIKNYTNRNDNSFYNYLSNDYQPVSGQYNHYSYTDQIYAAYGTFSQQIKKISYKAGLRLESSQYEGKLITTEKKFQNQYPFSAFPSAAATYSINDKNDLQLNYSRKVNRPNFFQLIPFIDYSDSLDLSKGNAELKPEFTHSLELSYLRNFNKKNNILVTAWYKNTTDVITRFQVTEFDSILVKNVIVNTYANANSAYAYGLELTSINSIQKWLDVMTNINFYNSVIDGRNLQSNLTNEQFSYFAKMNLSFKLPKNISLQLTGDYQSKTAVPISNDNGGNRMNGGGGISALQGYSKPNYGMDVGMKYEFLKNKAASITLNISDVFKTKKRQTYSASPYFIQNTLKVRDQQFLRLTFSYRFGKFDTSLFKRKNNKVNTDGMDNMQEM